MGCPTWSDPRVWPAYSAASSKTIPAQTGVGHGMYSFGDWHCCCGCSCESTDKVIGLSL